MPISTTKPSEIAVLSVEDDIKRGVTKIQYAFRFNITQTTIEEPIQNEDGSEGTQTVDAWQYDEITDELEIPLYLKPNASDILTSIYNSTKDNLTQILQLKNTEVPKDIYIADNSTTS